MDFGTRVVDLAEWGVSLELEDVGLVFFRVDDGWQAERSAS